MNGVTGSVAPTRRVREDFRDGALLMAFSAGTSVAIGVLLDVLVGLGK